MRVDGSGMEWRVCINRLFRSASTNNADSRVSPSVLNSIIHFASFHSVPFHPS